MATTTELRDQLKEYQPAGQRPSNTLLDRWISDAAQKIHERRGVSTVKETTITTTADVYAYNLPADCIVVNSVIGASGPARDPILPDFPDQNTIALGSDIGARLPTGQELTPGVAAISRQRARYAKREESWRLQAGQIVFDFGVAADTKWLIRYSAELRDAAQIPDRHIDLLLMGARIRLIEWTRHKFYAWASNDSEEFGRSQLDRLQAIVEELRAGWISGLHAIHHEVDT